MNLLDEYVERESSKRAINCGGNAGMSQEEARQDALSKWGQYLGQGEGSVIVGLYEGCGTSKHAFRPFENSIMRQNTEGSYKFGLVNEACILHHIMTGGSCIGSDGSSSVPNELFVKAKNKAYSIGER